MAGFSYTAEERTLIANLAKKQRDDLSEALKKADNASRFAIERQIEIATSIISKIEGVAA